MKKKILKKTIYIALAIILLIQVVPKIWTLASSIPSINATPNSNSTYSITANFTDNIPSGNIIDLELYNSSNQKVWQYYSTSGGYSVSATTNSLSPGTYTISAGLFNPNWSSNYAWYSNIYTINVPAPLQNTQIPIVTASKNPDSSYSLNINFSASIPSGNIIDVEIYNSSNQQIWQNFTTNGGTTYNIISKQLTPGIYTVSVGLFTPNWASNYGWYPKIYTIDASNNPLSTTSTSSQTPTSTPTPTPTPTTSINQNILNSAMTSYNTWKSKYVVSVNTGELRVVRPENNSDTVSEGIGYGMLISYFANDQTTFSGLWNYASKYLDSKGLMNWQIDSSGNVIGQGSATDADEDMAYALLRADSKWPGNQYGASAKKLIGAMMATEVQSSNLINPGDNWGNTKIVNPSYLAPAYYRAFSDFTGDTRWQSVADKSLTWEESVSNNSTGFFPDWINNDLSPASISWDSHPQDFFYDAVRTPIRLFMEYEWNNNQTAKNILSKENMFITSVTMPKLTSGYTLNGNPLSNYLDTTFLSSYASIAQVNTSTQLSSDLTSKLIQDTTGNYFGASLKTITLFVIAGAK